ncbi:Csu type fimbrial protein [Shewanella saliphila]|uniref:Spore coat protein U n=1 Tax=Shewanella saliphila TaxID=2282698 RepID=A0ABQ2Q0Y5_9GAMM|nr:spore coat U domain-containing protein [Shewanella saliphila]MCL1100387.1 spore coat U domain-containing protein [Shewanella saliphila]GGP37358.1 spore coat protein U [Shewanella saliphila]
MMTKTLIALLSMTPLIVIAEQAQDISEISIQIEQGCVLDNGSGVTAFGAINFGELSSLTYGAQATSTPGSGSIGFRCSPNLSYRIELGNGLNGTDSSNRLLLNNVTGETVPYQLFQDPGRAQIWDSTNAVSGNASGLFEWLPIYAAISPQAVTPSTGNYQDSVEVVLIF